MNCTSKNELVEHVVSLSVDNVFNDQYDDILDNTLTNPVLAADCSKIPIYYFKASETSGMKQDRFGNWYNVNCHTDIVAPIGAGIGTFKNKRN